MSQASEEVVVSVHAAEITPSVLSKGKVLESYSSETNRRKTVGVTLRHDLLQIARENRINLSQLLESSLIQLLDPQSTTALQNTPFLGTASFTKEGVWCGRRDLDPGSCRGRASGPMGPQLVYVDVRSEFSEFLKSRGLDPKTAAARVSYLEKYLPVLSGPSDVIAIFAEVKTAREHVIKALRTWFNFYESMGVDKSFLDSLRKALPQVHHGIDLRIPTESKLVDSLKKLSRAPKKYQALYQLLTDSGLRLVEGCELINRFQDAESLSGFYRCELSMFRGEKQAYYGHFTERTLYLVQQVKEKLESSAASTYFRKRGYINPKYLRKFAFDKMIELEVPESVADFIEGRVPKRIGAKHYMALARQAAKFYPRYARYLKGLRKAVS